MDRKFSKKVKKLFLIFMIFAFSIIGVNIILENYFFSNHAKQEIIDDAVVSINEKESIFNKFLHSAKFILGSLYHLKAFQKYFNDQIEQSEVEDIFAAFIRSHGMIDQIRYIDKNGIEKINLRKDKSTFEVITIPKDKLQNKSQRYYYKQSKIKEMGKVWFSVLDLNIEHGKVEIPYNPQLRAVLPLAKDNKFAGLLIINYSMKEFLKLLILNNMIYETILFNDRGYTLNHFNNQKSWGYYQEPKYTIFKEFQNDFKIFSQNSFYKTDTFVYKKLKLPIEGGVNIVIKIKESYIQMMRVKKLEYNLMMALNVFIFSLLLALVIIKIFSKTLLNIDELKKLNNYLKTASQRAKLGFWEFDHKTKRIQWSEGTSKVFGLETPLPIDESYISYLTPETKDQAIKDFKESLEKKKKYVSIYGFKSSNNEIKYFHVRGEHHYTKSGEPLKSLGSIYDITQKHRRNIEIKEKKQEFETIFNISKDGIAIIDLQTNILLFNESYLHMLGYSKEELKNKTCLEMTHPEYRDSFKAKLSEIVKIGYLKDFEKLCITKEGQTIDINISMALMPDRKRFLLSVRDISKSKNIEFKLKEYVNVVDKYVITSATDLNGTITYVSKAFSNISGYTKEEMVGKNHNILRHPDMKKELFEDLWKTIKSDGIWQGEIKNKTKKGGYYWVEAIICPNYDRHNNKIGYISIRIDISDKKKIEQAAITDGLTNIFNRRYFNTIFPKFINSAKRDNKYTAFLLMDIDHFK